MSAAFSYKITTENEQFTFDFTPVLGTSETLTAATCVVEVKEGTDSNPSAIMSGTPIINGTKVAQRIYGGLDGVTYRLEIDRKSTRLNSSHSQQSRMPSSA